MSEDQNKILSEISEKLSNLISLGALTLISQKDIDQKTKVEILTKVGFKFEDIGKLLDISADSVRRLRSRAKSD
jgi:DNA-directed RNA polymerase specialized sigma24 family protein